jgi:hypothetical protein
MKDHDEQVEYILDVLEDKPTCLICGEFVNNENKLGVMFIECIEERVNVQGLNIDTTQVVSSGTSEKGCRNCFDLKLEKLRNDLSSNLEHSYMSTGTGKLETNNPSEIWTYTKGNTTMTLTWLGV